MHFPRLNKFKNYHCVSHSPSKPPPLSPSHQLVPRVRHQTVAAISPSVSTSLSCGQHNALRFPRKTITFLLLASPLAIKTPVCIWLPTALGLGGTRLSDHRFSSDCPTPPFSTGSVSSFFFQCSAHPPPRGCPPGTGGAQPASIFFPQPAAPSQALRPPSRGPITWHEPSRRSPADPNISAWPNPGGIGLLPVWGPAG